MLRCLVPWDHGALYHDLRRDGLWDKFFTAAPQQLRVRPLRTVEQGSFGPIGIADRSYAGTIWPDTVAGRPVPSSSLGLYWSHEMANRQTATDFLKALIKDQSRSLQKIHTLLTC